MIHVTYLEIKEAFRKHRQRKYSSSSFTITDKMVLFYTVECGLKALFMKKHNLKKTDQANSHGENAARFGHDLNKLLKKNGFSSYNVPEIKAKDSTHIPAKSLHEVWRYGKTEIETSTEQKCLEELDKILKELKEKLG